MTDIALFLAAFVLFALVLSVLIVAHEWGHFFVARRLGVRVERFSIGFGPILIRRVWSGTEFCVSLVPLGGYVKLSGENPRESQGAEWEFHGRPHWQRALIVLAGPVLNAVLAFVVFSGIFMAGRPVTTSRVGGVLEGYPAQEAGIEAGDVIVSINGEPIRLWEELLWAIRGQPADQLLVGFRREGDLHEVAMHPRAEFEDERVGKARRIGRIGIRPSEETVLIRFPFFQAIYMGAERVVLLTGLILSSVWMMITGVLPFRESFTGPIGIFFLTQQMAEMGWIPLLNFVALLSVSLFVLNLFPIPVLDGGHLLFIGIEALSGRRLSEKVKEKSAQVGFCLLMVLILFVIYQDLERYEILAKLISFFSSSE